jgi:hypothetical protein
VSRFVFRRPRVVAARRASQSIRSCNSAPVASARVHVDRGGRALLDLGEVRGSVAVRVNGEDCGVVFCAPWRIEVPLRQGDNEFELEVAGTLAPLVARGVPTVYGPEDQRACGILGRPRLLYER